MAKRKIYSIKEELISKSREAILSAASIYNNPNIDFKSETFIVLSNIAWTYLMHAYYKGNNIEYRYYKQQGKRKKFDTTNKGAYKYWELERCLNDNKCPLPKNIKSNLMFLIGIRHEIEHQRTDKIDDTFSAKFQACLINYNKTIIKLFGKKYDLSSKLNFSLQLFSFSEDQISKLIDLENVPKNIINFISDFESNLTEDEIKSADFSYKVAYIRDNANREGKADKAIRFVDEKTSKGKEIQNILIKSGKESAKYKPKQIVLFMQKRGFKNFSIHKHTLMWQSHNAKNSKKNYGVELEDGNWYWYHSWLEKVQSELEKETSIK